MKKRSYIRHADGMPVTEDEAMENGVLKAGYLMAVGMRLADGAAIPNARGILMADSGIRFMDNLPTADSAQINTILADYGSNEVFRVRRAADAARRLGYSMHAAGSGAVPGYFGDSQAAAQSASSYLHGLADQAMKRVGEMYAAAGRGDTSVNAGGDRLVAQAAYARHVSELGDAWRGDDKPATANRTNDAVADAQSARAAYVANLSKAWEH